MFIHLTNYSINKGSELFEQNIDPEDAQVKRLKHGSDHIFVFMLTCFRAPNGH